MTTSDIVTDKVRLETLTVALQPIMDLRTGRVHGFEALLRGPEGTDIGPRDLLRRARREHWLQELEERAQGLALLAAERFLQGNEILFLNVDSYVPSPRGHYPHLALEIKEGIGVPPNLLAQLQREHFSLYLDDYGESHGNIESILHIRPRGLKLSRSLVRGIADDSRRFAIARTLTALAGELGMELIANGIESGEDLCAARSAGFAYGQGHYLGRPMLAPSRARIAATATLLRGAVIETVMSARHRTPPVSSPAGETL